MPGKTITDHQVHKYKQHRNKLSQVASAAKAGFQLNQALPGRHRFAAPRYAALSDRTGRQASSK